MNQNLPPLSKSSYNYRKLRNAIGIVGIMLPFVLIFFSVFFENYTDLQPSVSDYYFTHLRELFTGSLCAVGLFMVQYKGFWNISWWRNDTFLTRLSGCMAFGVAFFPCRNKHYDTREFSLIPGYADTVGNMHYVCAALLFLLFALLCIFVFTLGQHKSDDIPLSRFNENNIYRFCGIGILVCMILVPITRKTEYSTLVLETLCLCLFGFAWLVKGRFFGDSGTWGEIIYRERN